MDNSVEKFFNGRIFPSDSEKQFVYDLEYFKYLLEETEVNSNPLKYLLSDYFYSYYEC